MMREKKWMFNNLLMGFLKRKIVNMNFSSSGMKKEMEREIKKSIYLNKSSSHLLWQILSLVMTIQ